VRLHDRATGDFFCSGVVISQNYIVTAGHCLEGRKLLKKSIEVRSLDNTPIKNYAAPAFREQRSDQGLVIGNFSDFNAQPYSVQTTFVVSAFLSPEAQIMTCGFPYGGTAICEPVNNRHPFYFGFMADGVLYPGMSGGPVMVNMSGTGVVVGVNTAMIEGEAFYSPLVELLHHAKVEGQ
jgi:hypothetical protein